MDYDPSTDIPDLNESHWAYDHVMNATQGNLLALNENLGELQKNFINEINNIINDDK